MSGMIIKAGDARRVSGGLYSLDLRDIAARAEEMLAAARDEADRHIEEARARANAEREAARQAAQREGWEKGLAEGRASGHDAALAEARERFAREQATLVTTLTGLVEEFTRRREQLYAAARRDVVVLAIAIGARIAEKFALMADVESDAAAQACAEALSRVSQATEVVVRAHPEDAAAVQHLSDPLSATFGDTRHVRIVEDAGIARGGVAVEAADARIDAAIKTRVERIADELVTDWRDRMRALSIES